MPLSFDPDTVFYSWRANFEKHHPLLANPKSVWDIEDDDDEACEDDEDDEDDVEVQKGLDIRMSSPPLFFPAPTPTPAPVPAPPVPTQTRSSKGKATDSTTPKPKPSRYVAPVVQIIGDSLDWSVANTDHPFDSSLFDLNNPRTWPDTDNHKDKVTSFPTRL